ncbi:alpha-glycosidase [Spirochaetia bacterium]|nr:alpha-glycosidase [Spirochaetia bacterium]
MNKHAIYHRPRSSYAYFDSPGTVFILFRSGREDIEAVEIFHFDKYIHRETLKNTKMEKFIDDELFSYYRIRLTPPYKRLAYYFKLTGKDGEIFYYDETGFCKDDKHCERCAFQMPYINDADVIRVPQWAKSAVFYHIFPDSFARSEPFFEGAPAWGTEPHVRDHRGGNLRGMIDNFSHIKELGVNALYLCPLFASGSAHRYNTSDYKTIDPRLGTMDDFKEFLDLCHKNSVRVLLDAVFNHTCDTFPAFKDIVEKGEASKYKDWYFIRSFPVQVDGVYRYDRFAFTSHMPKLNTANREVKEYLLDVVEFWTKTGIDGWRLDVANEVDLGFWRDFRKKVKSVNSEVLIIGEIWNDSTPYLDGDMMDSVMNYPFAASCSAFFLSGEIDLETFKNQISTRLTAYPYPMTYAMYNLFGSHDTARWFTEAKGDIKRITLSIVFQFCFPGMPAIYYGDETGMEGENAILARRCMNFTPGETGQKLLALYKKLIALRKNSRALCEGDFEWSENSSGLLSFTRRAGDEEIRVDINNSNKAEPIEPMGYRIYRKKTQDISWSVVS